MAHLGRKEIFTDVSEVTAENIQEVLKKAFVVHQTNAAEIKYLVDYEKGKQPVLEREKAVRPEINYKIVENHAAEITSFKVGYVFSSPITYVQRASVDSVSNNGSNDDKRIAFLNEMMFELKKPSQDKKLGKDLAIGGLGYRIVLPKKKKTGISPVDILKLDPQTTFVVRYNDIYKKPIMAVTYVEKEDGNKKIGAYTESSYFEIEEKLGPWDVKETKNQYGIIPIVEYSDNDKMGCFEKVLPLLDALNEATSDRLNGLAQFVQSILWMNNCDIDKEQMEQLKDKLGLLTKSEPGNPASVEYLTATLDQTQTQTLIDYLYEQILQIAGVPGREQSTGGNTGQAILLSNGWQLAETHARSTELSFEDSEREMLEVVLHMCKKLEKTELDTLKLSDIDIKFSRNKTDSLLVKTQGLMNQLTAGIHPLVAITTCGLYSDPQTVYNDSKPYLGKWLYDAEEGEANVENSVHTHRRSGGEDNQEDKQTV